MLKKYQEFIPKSIRYLRKYNKTYFKKDLIAGATVGIVAIPLAMAFAMASGVDPERGLYTAIIGGFLISFLGGCRLQIGGPTAAFVVVVYSIVQKHGYDGLVLATVLAGLMLLAMGFFRLGTLIKYIPHPLVTGFTTGIAVVVFSAQIKDFFGLNIAHVPADFLEKWQAYFQAAATWNPTVLMVALGSFSLILFLRRYSPSLPWGIGSIALATAVCWGFDIPVDTIASRFGQVPRTLPSPGLELDLTEILKVLPDAITIALLAGIESLLSAVIADGMTGSRYKPNCELVAQGIANIGSVFFGGIPATAAIARTATNIKSGAQTPVAGMIHAAVIFLTMLVFAPVVGHIPLAALSAVLLMVAWNMSEIHHFLTLLRASKSDVVILLSAFFLTVLVDLTVAVEIGMILAAFLFMKRMGDLQHVIRLESRHPEHGVEVYEMRGPFFFGVADRLKEVFHNFETPPKIFILRMKHVPVLDATGLHTLREIHHRCKSDNTRFVLVDIQTEPLKLLSKFGLTELIGDETVFNGQKFQ